MPDTALRFIEISPSDRRRAGRTEVIRPGEQLEVRVVRPDGGEAAVPLPPEAMALVEGLIERLLDGQRVAVVTEEQELTPNEAARILRMSRPLVVHRMDTGDLPFRRVGKHRRVRLKDVLALAATLEPKRKAMAALVEDGSELEERFGA